LAESQSAAAWKLFYFIALRDITGDIDSWLNASLKIYWSEHSQQQSSLCKRKKHNHPVPLHTQTFEKPGAQALI